MTIPEYLAGNVEAWEVDAAHYINAGEKAWASKEPYWGIWQIPESQLEMLPSDMTNMDCIELGCGTGYVSAWMSRRGASVTGIDPTPAQLETARTLQAKHGDKINLLECHGENTPFADASFDFAISEYGAALWADPYSWIPEAARLLRPGGKLVFLTNSALFTLCLPEYDSDGPVRETLLRPYFGMHRINWPDEPGQTEFHLPHGEWIKLFRANGFQIDRLAEPMPPSDAVTRFSYADLAWARSWPSEEVWFLTRC